MCWLDDPTVRPPPLAVRTRPKASPRDGNAVSRATRLIYHCNPRRACGLGRKAGSYDPSAQYPEDSFRLVHADVETNALTSPKTGSRQRCIRSPFCLPRTARCYRTLSVARETPPPQDGRYAYAHKCASQSGFRSTTDAAPHPYAARARCLRFIPRDLTITLPTRDRLDVHRAVLYLLPSSRRDARSLGGHAGSSRPSVRLFHVKRQTPSLAAGPTRYRVRAL